MNTRNLEKLCCALATAPVATTGCGPVDEDSVPVPSRQREQAQESDNGLSFNGLSFNGLSFNGLSFNGLSFNGLSTSSFNSWFQSDPVMADRVMRYVVRCAVPSGQTRTYAVPGSSTTYTWEGGLGLAPGWAGGSAATLSEQQVMSACLAAHANRLGAAVAISVLGRDAQGNDIPSTSTELATYSRKESCFFGNLFNGDGIYVGAGEEPLDPSESTSRACGGLLSGGTEAHEPCAPMVYVGSCTSRCTLDSSGLYFTSCTWNGITSSRPITTRLRVDGIQKCGDTKCQAPEKCGTSSRWNNCGLDDCCGP